MYVHLITHTVRYIEKCFICQMRSDILQSFIKILPNRLLQKLIKKKKRGSFETDEWKLYFWHVCTFPTKMVFPPKYCLCIRTYISTLEAKTLCQYPFQWCTRFLYAVLPGWSVLLFACCIEFHTIWVRRVYGVTGDSTLMWLPNIKVKIVNKLNERKLWVVCLYVHVFSVHRNLLSIQSKYTPALYATKPLREESAAPTAVVGLANLCDRGWRKKSESIGRPVQACGAGEG